MQRIRVKAVEGRIARIAPSGPFIPSDRFIDVIETKYIRRLIDVHGDAIQEPEPKPEPKAEPKAKSASKETN